MDGCEITMPLPRRITEAHHCMELCPRQLVDLKEKTEACSSSPFIRRLFNRAWVPGEPQIPFAQKLPLLFSCPCKSPQASIGVAEEKILSVTFTRSAKRFLNPRKSFTSGDIMKSRACANCGRQFMELSSDFPEWELHCIGTGETLGLPKHSSQHHPPWLQATKRIGTISRGCSMLCDAQQEGTLSRSPSGNGDRRIAIPQRRNMSGRPPCFWRSMRRAFL